MSLNFDLRGIPEETRTIVAEHDSGDGAYKAGDRIMNPVTNALIWITMQVGIGEITEQNADEFFARVSLSERLFGANLRSQAGDRYLTFEDVKAHVGLKTNVFPKESKSKWLARIFDVWEREQVQARKRAEAQAHSEEQGG